MNALRLFVKETLQTMGRNGGVSAAIPSMGGGGVTRVDPRQARGYSSLPKQPVPPLDQTLDRFLRVVRPIVSDNEYNATRLLADEMRSPSGDGPELQKYLETRFDRLDNWFSDWWLSAAYLDQRCPLPINVSPAIILPHQPFHGEDGQLHFAARVATHLYRYKHLSDNRQIPIDMAGNSAMDMSQYDLLFGTCRIPGQTRDTIRAGYKETHPATHFVVAHNGHFFRISLVDDSKEELNEEQIFEAIRQAVDNSPSPVAMPVGVVTSAERPVWASMYQRLRKNRLNAESLEAVETALFVICLDQPVEKRSFGQSREEILAEQCLYGGGANVNSCNRWFDKTMQLIVGHNGYCGVTYEHSPAEGPPVANLMDHLLTVVSHPLEIPEAIGELPKAKRLNFELTAEDGEIIQRAAQRLDSAGADVECRIFSFSDFGKNFPKSQNVSPDSFIQLSFQLAYHKMHGSHAPCYETGTLRRFRLGRTDTIRLPSVESVAFVESVRANQPAAASTELFRRAVAAHKHYSTAAMSGEAIDRHLLGLRMAAKELGRTEPRLFAGEAYGRMMSFRLSTSQVPTQHDISMAFGPSAPDCYGLCYNPQQAKINFSVTAFRSCTDTSAARFAEVLSETLREMRQMMLNGAKSKL